MPEALLGLRGGDKGGEIGSIGLGLGVDIQVARCQFAERRPSMRIDTQFFARSRLVWPVSSSELLVWRCHGPREARGRIHRDVGAPFGGIGLRLADNIVFSVVVCAVPRPEAVPKGWSMAEL